MALVEVLHYYASINGNWNKTMTTTTLSLNDIRHLTENALYACGARGAQLDAATESVVSAEAEGIRIVGLGFLSIYCDQLLANKIDGQAQPQIFQPASARIHAHANNGFCHTAFLAAFDDWITMTKNQGIGLLTISHSNSGGVVGWFVEQAAQQGMICLGFSNSSPMMAPVGGTKPFHGTNPLAFACPAGDNQPPLVIDMATSQVAYVAVKERADAGLPIPESWGRDANGQPTTDPWEVVNGGQMGPLGGDKGALLALMVDILAGGLGGPSFSYQASSIVDDQGGPMGIGQTFIAIDPSHNPAQLAFLPRMHAMLDAMSEAGSQRYPGLRRAQLAQQAETNGIEVDEALLEEIKAYIK